MSDELSRAGCSHLWARRRDGRKCVWCSVFEPGDFSPEDFFEQLRPEDVSKLTIAELQQLAAGDPRDLGKFGAELERAVRVLEMFWTVAAQMGFSHSMMLSAYGEVLARQLADTTFNGTPEEQTAKRARYLDVWTNVVRRRVEMKVEQRAAAALEELIEESKRATETKRAH